MGKWVQFAYHIVYNELFLSHVNICFQIKSLDESFFVIVMRGYGANV